MTHHHDSSLRTYRHDLGCDCILLLDCKVACCLVGHEGSGGGPDQLGLRLKLLHASHDHAKLRSVRCKTDGAVVQVVQPAVEEDQIPLDNGAVSTAHEHIQAVDHERRAARTAIRGVPRRVLHERDVAQILPGKPYVVDRDLRYYESSKLRTSA